MVSMTATAVKIEKIIDPLPNTEGAAARLQHEKEMQKKKDLKQKRREREK